MRDHPSIYKKIVSINDLSQLLETNEDLITISKNSENYYLPNPIITDSNRQTYTVLSPLKEIHKEILNKILDNVQYPPYLFGGIKGTNYIKDAELHRNAKQIIHEDVSHFFDNINGKHIYNVWYRFFKLPHQISIILTDLTTYHNKLPQGAKTSTHLSNLVFWEFEPDMVSDFEKKGFIYSRFIDDISISSQDGFTIEDKQYIIGKIFGMMCLVDLKPKREKHKIENRKNKISVHNLNLNSRRPTISKKERGQIRAAIFQLENDVNNGLNLDNIPERIKSLEGRAEVMRKLHPLQGEKYINRLRIVKEIFLQTSKLDGKK